MAVNKKGIVFTLISILFAAMFILFLQPIKTTPIDEKMQAIRTRILYTNSYLSSLNEYIQICGEISAKSAMEALINYEIENNFFYSQDNLFCNFQNIMFNGSTRTIQSKPNTRDLAFDIEPGLYYSQNIPNNPDVDLFLNSTHIYMQTINFSVIRTIDKIKLYFFVSPNSRPINIFVDLYDNSSGKCMGSPLDSAYAKNVEFQPGNREYSLEFEKKIKISNESIYYLIIYSDYEGSEIKLRVEQNDLIPYSNVSNITIESTALSTNLKNITFSGLMAPIIKLFNDNMNIKTSYTVNSITLNQSSPMNVEVKLNISYLVNDTYAYWKANKLFNIIIPIEGLKDPLYGVNSQNNDILNYNKYIKKFKIDPELQYIWSIENNITAFSNIVNNNLYFWSSRGPSFLSRLVNSTEPSVCCGLESLIDPDWIYNLQGNNVYSVDFIFFNDTMSHCNTKIFEITNNEVGYFTLLAYLNSESLGYYKINSSFFQEFGCE
ncbi:MAG: hypothetical protein QXG00_03270 [Candidatus Woesearchaeota archaeon]